MKSIISIISLLIYFKLGYAQNLIKNGQDFEFETNECNSLKHWEIFEQPIQFCELLVEPNCVKMFRFSTSLNNINCFDNSCGEQSDFTPSGVNGIPSSRTWLVQNTPNSLAGLDEAYIGFPLVDLIFDTRGCTRSGITQKIRKLKAGHYTLKFDAVFKTPENEPGVSPLLTVELDDNESINDPEFTENIIVFIDGGNNNTEWQHINISINIEEDCEIEYIRIFRKFGEKRGFILVDNIILESECAEENRCKLNKFEEDNQVTSNNIHNALTPLTFIGLAGLPFTILLIYRGNDIVASKAFAQPLNTIYWDGKDNNGNELENREYKYKLMVFTHCDCGYTLEESFDKTGNMNIPFPILENAIQSASTAIKIGNLSNVHEMRFQVFMGQSNVFNSPTYINPPNQFYWNGNVSGNGFLASGYYILKVFAKNNCGEEERNFLIEVISPIELSNFQANTFLNTSIPKDNFECSKTNHFPAYYAPLPCCSTSLDLNYSNGYIDGNQTFEAAGSIYLGDGLTVLPNSNINFYANETIEVNPGVEIDGANSIITLENLSCAPQRVGIINNPISSLSENITASILNEETFSENSTISVFPNPASNSISISSSEELKNILVFNLFGEQIYTINKLNKNMVEIETDQLSNGVYIFSIETENVTKRERVIIQK